MKDFQLTGAQRRYKQSGAKMLPRDAYMASMLGGQGYRSSADLVRAAAAETAAFGPDPHMTRSERKVRKLKKGMSARSIKRVERCLFDLAMTSFGGARNQKRLYNYMVDVFIEDEIRHIDARMLANAY